MKFYEQNWHHKEKHRLSPPILQNDLTLDNQVTCPECNGEVTYERDHDETVCTNCGLVISSSHRYVAGHRIYLPFIDDRPPEEPLDHIVWWRNFLVDFKPFIYPDDRRYYDPKQPKQAGNRS